ncbi:MAG TPA: PilZ domain-containing protein [Solirubrobacteraceae bacterium]|jgi:hypothetical protein
MRSKRAKSETQSTVELPKRSQTVTLIPPEGEPIPARVAEREKNALLVVVMVPTKPWSAAQLEALVLEFVSPRSRVRLRGTVTVQESDLLRFEDLHSIEVLQQREYVRIRSARPVLVVSGREHMQIRSYTVDLSGGGFLLAGPDTLKIGERIQFQLTVEPGGVPITGTGTVVRSDNQGRRAVCFEGISEGNQRRLIRFIFECQRAERRRGLELDDGHGG